MKNTHKLHWLAVTLVGAAALSTNLFAQEGASVHTVPDVASEPTTDLEKSASKEDSWRLDFAIIGWGPSVSGDVTVRGHKANVDASLDDLLHDLKGIAMLGFELRKEKFGFYAQPNWIKLKEDATVGPLSSTLEQEMWIVDAAGFYQIHKWGEEKPLTLDALAGVRYWHLDHDITVKGSGGLIDFHGSDSNYLIDPILGLRAKIYFTRKFSLALHGDVGGFGASDNSSDLSWQGVGTLGYDFNRIFSLSLGYRALSLDKGSGSGPDAKGLNTVLHGFLLALDFHW